MEDNRSRRNEMRDTVAALQQKFQEQSIQQNTARLNIEQLEKKAEEIRGGYTRIEREQEEIRLQARDMQADNIKITQELEASKRDEEELETFIETRQKELEDVYKRQQCTICIPKRFRTEKGQHMSEMVKVVVDAMGGDNAPEEPVKAAVEAVKEKENIQVILTGVQDVIEAELRK